MVLQGEIDRQWWGHAVFLKEILLCTLLRYQKIMLLICLAIFMINIWLPSMTFCSLHSCDGSTTHPRSGCMVGLLQWRVLFEHWGDYAVFPGFTDLTVPKPHILNMGWKIMYTLFNFSRYLLFICSYFMLGEFIYFISSYQLRARAFY